MKVFLSHPMSGLSEDEVLKLREDAVSHLKEYFPGDIEIVENYYHENAPENAGRLWHLGRSIQQMEENDIDAIYFCGDYTQAKGCLVEVMISKLYGIEVLNNLIDHVHEKVNPVKIEVEWSGQYPILCMGKWSLHIDGNDATNLIPDHLISSEMNTVSTDSFEEWRKEYPECSDWIMVFPDDVRHQIYEKIKEKDFIKHTCGGCL